MEKRVLQPGEVVQIHPEIDTFGGSLMIVTESKSWGAQGYVQIPGRGQAHYRCTFENMEPTGGSAPWQIS